MWLKYLIEVIKNNDEQHVLEVTQIIATQTLNEVASNGSTALHWLAWGGYHQAAQVLLDTKPELINILDNDGFSVLHYAALNGSVKTIDVLLKAKPQLLYVTTNSGSSVLKAACWGEHLEAISLLHSYQNTIKNEKKEQIKTQLIYSDQYDFMNDSKSFTLELIAFEKTNENLEM